MKRSVFTIAISLLLVAPTLHAANVYKYTFTDVTTLDGKTLTIRAGVKIVKRSNVTVCGYYDALSDQFLGQYENTDNASTNAPDVEQYCLLHYPDRAVK